MRATSRRRRQHDRQDRPPRRGGAGHRARPRRASSTASRRATRRWSWPWRRPSPSCRRCSAPRSTPGSTAAWRCSSSAAPARSSSPRPVSILAALARATRNGVLIKGGVYPGAGRQARCGGLRQDRHAHRRAAAGDGRRGPRTGWRTADVLGWRPPSSGSANTRWRGPSSRSAAERERAAGGLDEACDCDCAAVGALRARRSRARRSRARCGCTATTARRLPSRSPSPSRASAPGTTTSGPPSSASAPSPARASAPRWTAG